MLLGWFLQHALFLRLCPIDIITLLQNWYHVNVINSLGGAHTQTHKVIRSQVYSHILLVLRII